MTCISIQALWVIGLMAILPVILWFYWHQLEPVTSVIAQASGEVEVFARDGVVELMQVLPSSVVTQVVLVLHLQNANRRRVLVLWPDSAPGEVLRQWRVWLRWIWSAPQADESD